MTSPVVFVHALIGGLQTERVTQLGLYGLVLGVLHPLQLGHVHLLLLLILVGLFSFLRFDFLLQFVDFSTDFKELFLCLVVITFALVKNFILVLEIKQSPHHIALNLLASVSALFVLELDVAEDVVTNSDHLRAENLVQAAVIPGKLILMKSPFIIGQRPLIHVPGKIPCLQN